MSVQMHPVESSNIFRVGYDEEARELHIVFHKGGTPNPWEYVYREVPQEIFSGMLDAESKGKFFRAHVLNVYEFTKLPRE